MENSTSIKRRLNNNDINSLMSICHVSESRAIELLEATNGSLDRAIDLHFTDATRTLNIETNLSDQIQTDANNSSLTKSLKKTPLSPTPPVSKKKRQQSPAGTATLESFWGIPTSKKPKNPQPKINSFFTKSVTKFSLKDPTTNDKNEPESSRNESNESGKITTEESDKNSFYNNNEEDDFDFRQQSLENTETGSQQSIERKECVSVPQKLSSLSRTLIVEIQDDTDDYAFRNDSNEILDQSDKDFQDTSLKREYKDQNGANKVNAKFDTSTTSSDETRSGFPFLIMAEKLEEVTGTTKRNSKLNSLKDLFVEIISFVGGIHDNSSRINDSLLLSYAIDLILGKISTANSQKLLNSSSTMALPQPIPLQISGSAVSIAIQEVTGASKQQLREKYRKSGDVGDVAAELYSSTISNSAKRFFVIPKNENEANKSIHDKSNLCVERVHATLFEIATVESGQGSGRRRHNLIVKLMRSCQNATEIRFIVRILLGNMRLGATTKSILSALATAVHQIESNLHDRPQATIIDNDIAEHDPIKILQATYNVCPRIFDISNALLRGGIELAAKICSISVGFPIQPMLADPADSFERVRQFMQYERDNFVIHFAAVLEWKYDGVRCQAHWNGSSKGMKLYSRHLLDNTSQYPEVVDLLLEAKLETVESFVIDSEIVAVRSTGSEYKLMPFQDLSRMRGKQISDYSKERIQLRVYCFDIVYLNGVSLMKLPLRERQKILKASFKVSAGFDFATSAYLSCYDEASLLNAFQKAIDGGAEGLMIKLTGEDNHGNEIPDKHFGYEAGQRSKLWLKLKRDYIKGIADTIDVVPIGAWYGTGRKAEKGFLSPILLAVYNEDDGTFSSISRCMSFSDKMYTAMREFYFNGIPYPADVGIDDDNEGQVVEQSIVLNEEEDYHGEINQPSEAQHLDEGLVDTDLPIPIDIGSSRDEPDTQNRINCFESRPPSSLISTNESPAIWFKPLEVFEVSFADMSLSRAHTAAGDLIDDEQGRGIALRFPRFKRRRPDKSIEMATTCTQIAELYRKQSKIC